MSVTKEMCCEEPLEYRSNVIDDNTTVMNQELQHREKCDRSMSALGTCIFVVVEVVLEMSGKNHLRSM